MRSTFPTLFSHSVRTFQTIFPHCVRIYSFNTHLLPNLILFAIRNTTLLIILIILLAEDHFTARHIWDVLAPIFLLFNSLKRAGGPFGPPALFSKTIIDALAPYCFIIIASIMHIYYMNAKAKFTRLMPKSVWVEFIVFLCSGSIAIMYCYQK